LKQEEELRAKEAKLLADKLEMEAKLKE